MRMDDGGGDRPIYILISKCFVKFTVDTFMKISEHIRVCVNGNILWRYM
jgi:hypothetical protein